MANSNNGQSFAARLFGPVFQPLEKFSAMYLKRLYLVFWSAQGGCDKEKTII